jgi:hypothetical protein
VGPYAPTDLSLALDARGAAPRFACCGAEPAAVDLVQITELPDRFRLKSELLGTFRVLTHDDFPSRTKVQIAGPGLITYYTTMLIINHYWHCMTN